MDATPTKCRKCHRTLTRAASIALGFGPTCYRKVKAQAKAKAITAMYKPHQIAKAQELLSLGALVPLRDLRVFLVPSEDGGRAYRTHLAACTCPAGVKGVHPCKHRIAAHIVALAV
jgi:Family of unknown function (DUF6011)